MKVRLLQASQIRHEAGEIVEVSPARAGFLLSCGAAETLEKTKETATKEPEAEVPEIKEEVPVAKKTTKTTTKKAKK